MTDDISHVPVLLDEVLNYTKHLKDGVLVDATFGLGGYSKAFLENTNCKVINLRVSQIYGKYMKQNRIIPAMKKELKKNNKITVYGNGKRTINIISIAYLNKILNKIIYYNKNDTFNLGEENISLYKLAKRIIKQTNNNNNAKIFKEYSGKKERFFLDTSKVESLLK